MLAQALTNGSIFMAVAVATVLGAAHDWPWLGVALVGLWLAIHLRHCAEPARELRLLLIVGLIGAIWDGWMLRFGFLGFASGVLLDWLAPVWVVALWVALGMTLNGALRWLQGRWYLAFAAGILAMPLAYGAAAWAGAVTFPDPLVASVVVAGGWSLFLPLLLWLAMGRKGAGAPPTPSQPTVTTASSGELG